MSVLRKVTLLVICSTLLLPQSVFAGPIAIDLSKRSPVSSAARSAVFPGWGQVFNGQQTKGFVTGGVFWVSTIASIVLFNQADATFDDYEKRGVIDDPLYDDYVTQNNQATVAAYLAAATYLYGVIDAYVNGKSSDDEYALKKEGLNMDLAAGNTRLSYTKRF